MSLSLPLDSVGAAVVSGGVLFGARKFVSRTVAALALIVALPAAVRAYVVIARQ